MNYSIFLILLLVVFGAEFTCQAYPTQNFTCPKFDSLKESSRDNATSYHILQGRNHLQKFNFTKAKLSFQKARNALNYNDTEQYEDQKIKILLGLGDVLSWEHKEDSLSVLINRLSQLIKGSENFYYPHYLFLKGTANMSSDYEHTIRCFQEAVKQYPEGDRQKVQIYIWLADILMEQQELDSGWNYTRKAIEITRNAFPEDSLLLAYCYNQLGFYYHARGTLHRAVTTYEDSTLSLLTPTNNNYLLSETYRLLGWSYEKLGNYQKALRYKELNHEIKNKILPSNHYKLGESYYWLAFSYYQLGMLDKARGYLNKAIPILRKVSAESYIGQCKLYLGLIDLDLKRYQSALKNFKSALKLANQNKKLNFLGRQARINIALAHKGLKNNKLAMAEIDKDIAIVKNLPDNHYKLSRLSLRYLIKALFLQDIGQMDSSNIYFKSSIKLFEESQIENTPYKTRLLNFYARFLIEVNDLENVPTLLNQAVTNNIGDNFEIGQYPKIDRSKNGFEYVRSFHLLGRYFYKKYKNLKNIIYLKKATNYYYYTIQLINANRRNNSYKTKDKLNMNEAYSDLFLETFRAYNTLYNQTGDIKYLKSTFNISEESKSAVLLSQITERFAVNFVNIPDSLILKESAFKNQLAYLHSKIIKTKNQTQLPTFQSELFNAKKQYEELIKYFENTYPAYYDLKYSSQHYGIEEIKDRLDSHTILISYVSTDENNYAITITKDSQHLQTLPAIQKTEIEAFRKSLAPDLTSKTLTVSFNQFTNQANTLYEKLMAPVLNTIDTAQINSLIIIPDGLLSIIPFEALLTSSKNITQGDYKSLPYLLKKFNVSYGYSATSLFKMIELADTNKGKVKVLSMAPSVFTISNKEKTLPTLKYNRQEVNSLSDIFVNEKYTNERATEINFKSSINQHPITHLATHTVLNHEDPMYSKLVFAPSNDTIEDGMLHTFELYNMDINTDMMVLSACNTGFGKLQKGEGVMSLARAFAYAGCPSVVMSHWAVDDKSTSKLMQLFYTNLKKGLSKDKALRQAKLSFLANSSPIYHHPYYWNNFVVMGDTKPIAQNSTMVYWYIFAALILTVATALSYRKFFN